ncbi:hypothetical protein H6F76_24755 [Leptolyngbya sp. FACHB-321]|uniref:hypothetical protein n=1 Tax=Leptolyngbya sp. FACHB-321 TaxID=2692807 RepID=UPI00168A3FB4|nr:hypothetical protein [Leptolyngbya sp. FACHB-321]MBD2038168.1 hypothetical protein [Leptolyngbya sp. FACHB-321]
MTQVLIVVESVGSAETTTIVSALERAISVGSSTSLETTDVKVISASDLSVDAGIVGVHLLCPLTLSVPEKLVFPAQTLYAACRDVAGLRKQLEAWQYITGDGTFWLPIVLTAKGALYGEVIGSAQGADLVNAASASGYIQPVHLSDYQRQPLYALGQRLLRSLNALPAVYLMQFGWQDGAVCFDRLFPFPAAPAIASLKVQTPDLFACHWACLTGQPLLDLTIR